ncbi:MAG: alpha/beta hydrolase [Betaproteobacteria bacterium]|nr:alpha/beta hydrolase [Betaproteobacteria bacterium]
MAAHIPGPLHFHQQGPTGIPMIFLHSTPDDYRLWLYQQAHFSSWYRTVAVDLAGYGRSPIPQPGVTIPDQAAACWEVLDRVAPGEKAIVHGNSMGSMIAKHMVHQQPERSRALIISGTGYLPVRSPMARWEARYKEEGIDLRYLQCLDHFSPPAQALPLVQYYSKMVCELNNQGTLASIIAMNQALQVPDTVEFYAAIKTPTLIISGTADRNHATAVELPKYIKGSILKSIEGAGHAVMQEAPWLYDRYSIEFLASLGLWSGPASLK